MGLEQDELLRKCLLNIPSAESVERNEEIENYNKETHSDFIVKRDIIYILLVYGVFLFIFVISFESSYFKNQHLNQIFGNVPVPESIIKHRLFFWLSSIVFTSYFFLSMIYHLLTFWFKYLIIQEDGITDKISIFRTGFIPYKDIDSMNFWCGHLSITTKGKKKLFSCLKLSIYDKKKIDRLYFLAQKSS